MRISKLQPTTVGEAADQVISRLDAESLSRLRGMEETDLMAMHFGLGTWIRNVFGLWSGNKALLEDCASDGEPGCFDPDEASMVILREVWRRVRE